jgi:hypothetical protein
MNIINIFFFLIIISFTFKVNAQFEKERYQDVVLHLLSGDTILYKLSENNTSHLTGFKKNNNNDFWKFKIFSEEDVAFYTDSSQKKSWMYIPDFKNGKFLNYLEMESYLSGKKEAKYNYKPTKYLCSGVAFGLILGLLDTYQKDRGLLSKKNTTLLIATPLLSSIVHITKRNRNKIAMSEEQNQNIQFEDGFFSLKKSKNHVASFAGSLLAVISIFAINNN